MEQQKNEGQQDFSEETDDRQRDQDLQNGKK